MKINLILFIAAIFLFTNICSAQKPKESVILCNLPGKKIAPEDVKMPVDSLSQQVSLAEIKQFLASDCDRIIYTNAAGDELKISRFMFAYTYKSNGNSNFEQAKGSRLTNTMKERLKNAAPGDKIMVAVNFKEPSGNPPAVTPKAIILYKIVE